MSTRTFPRRWIPVALACCLSPAVHSSAPGPAPFQPAGTPKTAESRTARKALPEARLSGFRGLDVSGLPRDAAGRPLAARVNDVPIYADDLRRELRDGLAEEDARDTQRTAALEETLAASVLDRMITVEVIRQFARKQGIRVAENEIDREVADSDAVSKPGQKTADIAVRRGISMASIREGIRTELLVRKVEDFVTSSVRVTDADIAQVSATATLAPRRGGTLPRDAAARAKAADLPVEDELRVNHLVIRCPSGESEEVTSAARARAEKALAEIRAGLAFEEAVRRYSQDALTVSRGGDMGYILPSRMLPEFARAVYRMKAGEVSGVVRTRLGFHIIKVSERHAGNTHLAAQRLANRRAYLEWQKKALKAARIERFLKQPG